MAVNFYLASKGNKFGEFPVRVSIIIKKTRCQTTTGFSVLSDAWLPNNQSASKRKITNYVKIRYVNSAGMTSERMNAILKGIDAHFSEYENELKSKTPTCK